MLRRRYYSELRRCLGPDDTGLKHLELFADRAATHFKDIAEKIAVLLAGNEGGRESLQALSGVLSDIAFCLCSRESAAYAVKELAAQAKLSLAEVIGVIGFLHSELEQVARTSFELGDAQLIQAALGRRVVMELSLLHTPVASDLRIIESELGDSDPGNANSGNASSSPHERATRRVAHEIRNALNGAVLHLTFLERKLEDFSADDEALDAAHIIGREITRVAGLIDESLDAARSRASKDAVTSVKSLCTDALEQVSPSDGVFEVEDRPARGVEGVLLDLMQDVTESALQNGGRVLLTARRDGGAAIIEVEHGVPSEDVPDQQTWPSADGNLATAMQTVAECGGSLKVETDIGRTIFHVQFPSFPTREVVNN